MRRWIPPAGRVRALTYPRHMDGGCLEAFLEHLGEAYSDHHLMVVLDGAPSHRSKEITYPENVTLLALPSYSPESNPVERWLQEFR